MKYNIYYCNEIFSETVPIISELTNTHKFLISIQGKSLEDVYMFMQAEMWSPNGEAKPLITNKGINHTSMSCGDAIEDESGDVFVVTADGFKNIGNVWKEITPEAIAARI